MVKVCQLSFVQYYLPALIPAELIAVVVAKAISEYLSAFASREINGRSGTRFRQKTIMNTPRFEELP